MSSCLLWLHKFRGVRCLVPERPQQHDYNKGSALFRRVEFRKLFSQQVQGDPFPGEAATSARYFDSDIILRIPEASLDMPLEVPRIFS